MGCGASNEAQPTAVVPAASAPVDHTKPHKVTVNSPPAHGGHQTHPSNSHHAHGHHPSSSSSPATTLPPGLTSFRNSPQTSNGLMSSRRGTMGTDDDLPPVKTTPKGTKISPSVFPPGLTMEQAAVNVPPGSQIPGLNYCTPEFFPTHMEQCWNHYARPPEYKLIDKAGLKQMAEDAVNSFQDAVRKWIVSDNPRWSKEKVETKLALLRSQYLPGTRFEDAVVISTHFLAHELKFQAGEDSKSSGVTKPCFFLHFQRAHRMLFSFTPGAEITLERELIVQKLNKQGVERANKGLKSLTQNKSSNGLSSQKGVKSVKASSRHKSKRQSSKKNNMFGDNLDFDGPSQPIQEVEHSTSHK